MTRFAVVAVALAVALLATTASASSEDMTVLVSEKGYQLETHEVVTEDGYILDLFRIPYGKSGPGPAGTHRQPVLLGHGVTDSSTTWVVNGPERGLAFLLADAGHDVWMMNVRGNRFGLKHMKLTPHDKAFWEFTFGEHATHDLYSNVKKVLEVTGFEQIKYVGHSQGTVQMFAAASTTRKAFMDQHIACFVALAPVAYVDHTMSTLLKVLAESKVDELIQWLGFNEFLPTSDWVRNTLPWVCKINKLLCEFSIYLIAGLDQGDLDTKMLPTYVHYYPSASSVRNMVHFAQVIRQKKFQMYDFGEKQNEAVYGQKTPPPFDLGQMTLPTFYQHGGIDDLGDPADVKHLLADVPFNPKSEVDLYPSYGHLDFVWGAHVGALYNKSMEFLDKFPVSRSSSAAPADDSAAAEDGDVGGDGSNNKDGVSGDNNSTVPIVAGVLGSAVAVAGAAAAFFVYRVRARRQYAELA